MDGIQSLFWPVLAIVTALSLIAAVVALARSGRQWQDYGRSHLLMDRQAGGGEDPDWSVTAARERDEEIRELLAARNERRRRRGEAPVDVEAELERLTADPDPPPSAASGQPSPEGPRIDAALRAEIRELVVARNHRRARAGKPPLDVEAEVEREIAGLSELT